MYGKTLGTTTVASGVSLLPETGSSRPLFILAASLLVSGVAIFVATAILARRARRQVQAQAN